MKIKELFFLSCVGLGIGLMGTCLSAGVPVVGTPSPTPIPYCTTSTSDIRAGYFIPMHIIAASSTYPTTQVWTDGTNWYQVSGVAGTGANYFSSCPYIVK